MRLLASQGGTMLRAAVARVVVATGRRASAGQASPWRAGRGLDPQDLTAQLRYNTYLHIDVTHARTHARTRAPTHPPTSALGDAREAHGRAPPAGPLLVAFDWLKRVQTKE